MNAVTEAANFQIETQVKTYVNQYMLFANKTAENVLEMCRIVYEAKTSLKKSFGEFCVQINLNADSATISKMRTIGEKYSFLKQYKDNLPNAWTTLYYIAKLSDEKVQEGINEKVISPMATAKQLFDFAPSLRPRRSEPQQAEVIDATLVNSGSFSIKLDPKADAETVKNIKAKLADLCNQLGCEFIG